MVAHKNGFLHGYILRRQHDTHLHHEQDDVVAARIITSLRRENSVGVDVGKNQLECLRDGIGERDRSSKTLKTRLWSNPSNRRTRCRGVGIRLMNLNLMHET